MSVYSINRALISVSDKSEITELAGTLYENGVEILSTGGTAKKLREAGIEVIEVSDYTGSQEIFGGRVKTLHPKISGGILLRRDNPSDEAEAEKYDILGIDLVVVNLYPFSDRIIAGIGEYEALEEIDIGGVTLLRAAAKNYPHVTALCSPKQYREFLKKYKSNSGITLADRKKWAAETFEHTFRYDSAVFGYLSSEKVFTVSGALKQKLRYGENPHQSAEWFKTDDCGITASEQMWGKELSYLNVLDLEAAYEISRNFTECSCVIIKHTTPCGLAVGNSPVEAYKRAFSCDTRSPFGGIVGFNHEVDYKTAEELSKIFLEAVIAPSFEDAALDLLKKKKNLRLVKWGERNPADNPVKFVSISGGFLTQTTDIDLISRESFQVVTKKSPGDEQWAALEFGAKAVKWVKSNAVIFCNRYQTLGIGGGPAFLGGGGENGIVLAVKVGQCL